MTDYLLIALFSYLLGSIPFGLVLAKISGKGDIRKKGSGNIGATNAFRSAGPLIGFLTLILDVGKGAAAVLITQYYFSGEPLMALSGIMAVIGHIFPVWLRFKGGKGVATTLAVIATLSTKLALLFIAVALLLFAWKRIVSLSSVAAALITMVIAPFITTTPTMLMVIAASLLIVIKHKDNITRLRQGKEKPLFK